MRIPQQWSWFTLICSWTLTIPVQCNPVRVLRPLCGNNLSEMLSILCDGGYYSGHRSKRGIVEECCLKPCTIETLSEYCLGDVNPSRFHLHDERARGGEVPVEEVVSEKVTQKTVPLRFEDSQVGTVSPEYLSKAFFYTQVGTHQHKRAI